MTNPNQGGPEKPRRVRRTKIAAIGAHVVDPVDRAKADARTQVNDISTLINGLAGIVTDMPSGFTQDDVAKLGFFLSNKLDRAVREMQDALRGYPGRHTSFDFDTALLPQPTERIVRHRQAFAEAVSREPAADVPPATPSLPAASVAAPPAPPASEAPAGKVPASHFQGRLIGSGRPVIAAPAPAAALPPPPASDDDGADFIDDE